MKHDDNVEITKITKPDTTDVICQPQEKNKNVETQPEKKHSNSHNNLKNIRIIAVCFAVCFVSLAIMIVVPNVTKTVEHISDNTLSIFDKVISLVSGEIKINCSSDELVKQNADDVKAAFLSVGFKNVDIRLKESRLGFHFENEVKEVIIGGSREFNKGDSINKKNEVIIVAYTVSKQAPIYRTILVVLLLATAAGIVCVLFIKSKNKN